MIVNTFWLTYESTILYSKFYTESFGCNEVTIPGFNLSFRLHGQVYHRVVSVVPLMDEFPKFCQIYFIDDLESLVDIKCQIGSNLRISSINQVLYNDNLYV